MTTQMAALRNLTQYRLGFRIAVAAARSRSRAGAASTRTRPRGSAR
jgi:hypothetical protein